MYQRKKSNGRSPPSARRKDRDRGAWLPWPAVQELVRLNLRRPSHWKVYLAILLTCARYGGGEARLGVKELAEVTGLGERTVKDALRELQSRRLLARPGRYCRIIVTGSMYKLLAASDGEDRVERGTINGRGRGANKLAPPKGNEGCPSPTVSYCISSKTIQVVPGAFTSKQQQLIADVFAEAHELLGDSWTDLTLPDTDAQALGLPIGITYLRANEQLVMSGDRSKGRGFVRSVLRLRQDERVQGQEL